MYNTNELEAIDQTIAEQRDKRRYYLKDKRAVHIQSLFGIEKINAASR
jgi:hypothetical protein